MVQSAESVVTPQRFSKGMTYAEYVASIERNQKRFEENYAATEIAPADVTAFKALMAKPNGPAKMMVVGEDWCPDVFRGMPVFARLAEATGIELRVFKRDEHKDIIGEFLKDGEHESIPVAVFYTKDHRYIAHFIERPRLANDEMRSVLAPVRGAGRSSAPGLSVPAVGACVKNYSWSSASDGWSSIHFHESSPNSWAAPPS